MIDSTVINSRIAKLREYLKDNEVLIFILKTLQFSWHFNSQFFKTASKMNE